MLDGFAFIFHLIDDVNVVITIIIDSDLIYIVVKHASATQMKIAFSRSGANLEIELEDNGIGFDVNKIQSDGLGIKGVRNRIRHLNDTIEFIHLNQKTMIKISIPV